MEFCKAKVIPVALRGALMAVAYETIRTEFERLRDYVTFDLDLLISQDMGGNYIAASLITCACDAISYLKYGKHNHVELFFTEVLPDIWKPVAKNIYDAIRDGIVHVYETKTIALHPESLSIFISWKLEPHLYLSASGADLYVNISQLARDLKGAIVRFETDLKNSANLRDRFYKSMKGGRELSPNPSEKKVWQDLFSKAPRKEQSVNN